MVTRTNMTHTNLKARSGSSRATVREFDDDHLMQQVKKADVFHSETPSDFERFQMVGITAVPLKQEEEKDSKQQQKGGDKESGDWNHNQPKGKAAEALMLYLNGSRSHPVAIVDDRRVRPYAMKPGESAMYAASGTGQMLFHNDEGSYLVAVNNPQEQSENSDEKERYASLRHVEKKKQSREIKKDQKVEKHKHEGETVHTEVRSSKGKVEIFDGETVVGVYNVEEKSWTFSNFDKATIEADEEINFTSKVINVTAEDELNLTSKVINATATEGVFDQKGKPIKFNGGGPSVPPFEVPG